MRSLLPAALLGGALAGSRRARRRLGRGHGAVADAALGWLGRERTARVLRLLAGLEIAADKLPWLAARVEPFPLAGRALSGALVGLALAPGEGREAPVVGALVGAAAAIGVSFLAFYLRRGVGRLRVLPFVAALLEDAAALRAGNALLAP